MRNIRFIYAFLLLCACNNKPPAQLNTGNDEQTTTKEVRRVPGFNEDSAYHYVKTQVDFGPRVPGTPSHKKCFDYFVSILEPLADTVYIQKAAAVTYDHKTIPILNLIASFNPHAQRRILLCAHWDTRPFADQDTKDKDKPILGANDGASGTGILLQVAAELRKNKPDIGIDIILFDAEDWGDNSGRTEDSYCLGSQYWGKNTHVSSYKADFGILLDMVGAPNAVFAYEGFSSSEAGTYLGLVWSKAAEAGYDSYFKNFNRGYVTDDHYYIMKYTGIPTIDIIDCGSETNPGFGSYWHTHNDNMNAIDKRTLKAVGQTVLQVIYTY
jgi:hypothetical protein